MATISKSKLTAQPPKRGRGGRREGAGRPRNPPLPPVVPAPTLPAAYAALSPKEKLALYAPMAFEALALVACKSRNARARVSAARIILAYAAQDVPPVKRA
jgi:hypothetical protein